MMKKGPWTRTEDAILIEYVRKHEEGNWNNVQKITGLARSGKSCRLRWANHLRPNLKKGPFSAEEEHMIIYMHFKIGSKWARIASVLPGRTENEIKNFWYTRSKRCLKSGTPLHSPHSLCRPTNVPLCYLSPSSANFPHISTSQMAANLEGLLSTLGSPNEPSLSSLPSLPSLTNNIGCPLPNDSIYTDMSSTQIPPPSTPPSPASTMAPIVPDNVLLQDLLADESPPLPLPTQYLSNQSHDSLSSSPSSTVGVNTESGGEDGVGKEEDDLSGFDSFSSEMPMLDDWHLELGTQSPALPRPSTAQKFPLDLGHSCNNLPPVF